MAKRKGRKETQQTLTSGDKNGEEGRRERAGFFACYLLTSISPRFKGHTYIGYTLNPRRRIRQHNGEIVSGAFQTKKMRPWEMVLCIYGFPTNISALQFEWAWQHPLQSHAVRVAAANFKSLSGIANKIKLAYTMLTLPPWESLDITMNLFSTKYRSYTIGCPALPEHMRIRICSMDDLPCYNDEWDDNECEGSLLDKTEEEPTATGLNYGISEENVPQQTNHRDDAITESPPISKEDHGPSFIINDSPTRESFSFISSCIVEEKQSPRVVELTEEFPEPLKRQSAAELVAKKDQSPDIISHQVEIIDVFTPSPCRPFNSGSKKRRRLSLGPEIIDLTTNSPLFV